MTDLVLFNANCGATILYKLANDTITRVRQEPMLSNAISTIKENGYLMKEVTITFPGTGALAGLGVCPPKSLAPLSSPTSAPTSSPTAFVCPADVKRIKT